MSERVTVAARKAGGVERVTVMWRRGQRVTVAARKQGSGQYVVATLRSGGSQGRRAFKGVTVAARKKQGSGWAVDRGRKGHCGLAARKAGGRALRGWAGTCCPTHEGECLEQKLQSRTAHVVRRAAPLYTATMVMFVCLSSYG